jgi:DNA-binding MarR family transcriptional regulator
MNERLANLLGATALNVADLMLAAARRTAGTSGSASAAMIVLAENPDLPVTELGRRIGLSQPAAARMIDSLERQALVARRARTGRAVAVRLPPRGRRAANRLLDHRGQLLSELVADLEPDEQAALAALFEKVLRRVHARLEGVAAAPTDYLAELACRLCDRGACREDGAPCPISGAQRDLEAQQDQQA